jgi:hypothetical protein
LDHHSRIVLRVAGFGDVAVVGEAPAVLLAELLELAHEAIIVPATVALIAHKKERKNLSSAQAY